MLHNFHFDVHSLPYKICNTEYLDSYLGAAEQSSRAYPVDFLFCLSLSFCLSSQIKRLVNNF